MKNTRQTIRRLFTIIVTFRFVGKKLQSFNFYVHTHEMRLRFHVDIECLSGYPLRIRYV